MQDRTLILTGSKDKSLQKTMVVNLVAGGDAVQIGDIAGNNYLEVEENGGIIYHGNAGVQTAGISVKEQTSTTAVSSAGLAQFLFFDTNNPSNGAVPDHTNSHITISKAGLYYVSVSISIENAAGVGQEIMFEVQKNNGASGFTNLHAHRELAAGGGTGAIPITGNVDLLANDTLELWLSSDSAVSRDVVLSDCVMTLTQRGG